MGAKTDKANTNLQTNYQNTQVMACPKILRKKSREISSHLRLLMGPDGADLLGGGPPLRTGGPLFSGGGPLDDIPLKKGSTFPTLS